MRTNEDRANRALGAMLGGGYDETGDLQLDVVDLLTDLLHLIGPRDFKTALATARMHWREERDESEITD